MEFENVHQPSSLESTISRHSNESPNTEKGESIINSIANKEDERINLDPVTINTSLNINMCNKAGKQNIIKDTRNVMNHTTVEPQLFESQSNNLIYKRPELYVGLGPWDFLIDSSNVTETIKDCPPYGSQVDTMRMSKKKLTLTIQKLEDLIIKFQNLVHETCSPNIDTTSDIRLGKLSHLFHKSVKKIA